MTEEYTPASLLHLFNNVLAPNATKKIILLKGLYQAGRGVTYAGLFYDTLKDEITDAVVTLVVPALLRNRLSPNKTIEFYGYITKRVVMNGGRIEVQAVMTQLLQQTASVFTEKEVRSMGILQKKLGLGFRDVDGLIKGRIIEGANDSAGNGSGGRHGQVRIKILIGKTAIIDSDIRHALEAATAFYDIVFERINLSAEEELLEALRRNNHLSKYDLLAISRGGGENMEVFDSPDVAAFCLDLKPLFVTAIGHKEDISLVQQVADKAFITPTALGQYLNRMYNETVAELQHSKAKLVEVITQQLEANYEKQVRNLEEKIRGLEEVNMQRAGLQQRELELVMGQLSAARGEVELAMGQLLAARGEAEEMRSAGKRRQWMYWAVLVIVALLSIVLGRGCR